ncbi:glycosyltransferase family 4 protein [Streptomyces sp. NPDC046859]|uniref:glycosyltransferase family 4 protein n=1 Tax=Streptomyces sp. NPDC046859 TaxID=3155734 RepID=UPI0033FA0EB8
MTGPLNILVRVHAYPPDHNAGAEWALHEMLRALAGRGHRVTVRLSRSGGSRDTYCVDGVQVVPHSAGADRLFAKAVPRADAVISHLECVPESASLARGYGVPLIVVCHNTFDLTWAPLRAGSCALAVVNSQWMRVKAAAALGEGRRPDRVLVVRPPVWAKEYRTTRGDCITLINCTLGKGAHVLAALAQRMPERKFLAVRGAYGEQQPPNLHNVLVLDHVPGRQMRDEVYSRTRLLLMPSDYESWGRVGVEAMASGIPVLAHPTDGLRESLGDAGVFCERDDLSAWQAAIERLDHEGSYRDASRRAVARSKALDPTSDLNAWCDAVEGVTRARAAAR